MTVLFHSMAEHHDKYILPFSKIINDGIFIGQNEINQLNSFRNSYLAGITNSYLHEGNAAFNTPFEMSNGSISKKVITVCHSTYGSPENITNCRPRSYHEYFLASNAWSHMVEESMVRNIYTYDGHYMSLYHYENPPILQQKERVLFFPVSGIKDIMEIEDVIENFDIEVHIRPHPVTLLERPPRKWSKSSIGLKLSQYLELERKYDHVKIITENICLADLLDSSKYIIGSAPTSVLIEAAMRAVIWNQEKGILAAGEYDFNLHKYGFNYATEPSIDLFGFVNEKTINNFVIGHEKQIESLLTAIQKIVRLHI